MHESDVQAGRPPRIRLFYFTPSDLLVPRVDRQCIMRFLEALAARGVDVEAVSLNVHLQFDEPTARRGLFEVYGIGKPFPVHVLPTATRQSGDHNRVWRAIVFSTYAVWRLLLHRDHSRHDATVLYFKNYLFAPIFLGLRRLLGRRLLLLFEIHLPPERPRDRRAIQRVDGLLPINGILADELHRDFGIPKDRILVAHMGVNQQSITTGTMPKASARRSLGLPEDRHVAVYTGKVYDGYGEIDLLLATAHLLPEVEMLIVGGREDHVGRLRKQARSEGLANVRFEGFVAPADVSPYHAAADVLVTYYPGGIPLNRYRSPGKLFEYMASGRPIVTADYPALRQVLSPGAALFVEKDDPRALAAGIRKVLADPALGERLAGQARRDVLDFTWERRADRVIGFIERLREGRGSRASGTTNAG
ncbi:MAG: glycosyltransferase [Mycobacteriales bacterium]